MWSKMPKSEGMCAHKTKVWLRIMLIQKCSDGQIVWAIWVKWKAGAISFGTVHIITI